MTSKPPPSSLICPKTNQLSRSLATGTNVGGYQDPAALHSHEGTTHTAGHHTASSGTAGPSGNSSNVTGFNDPTGTHGPHGSRVANAADPRVDSDRDHRAAGTGAGFGSSTTTGHHTGHTGAGTGAGFGSSNTTTGYDDPTGTHGPHGSRVANAADPRVDSDRDHRAAGTGAGFGSSNTPGYGDHTTHTGHTGHTGAGTGAGAGFGSSNATTGYNDPVGTHGTHNSRAANAADPRIDSDRDHRNAPGTAGTAHYGSGPGPAANTAGPHKSDVLNKADPRVDSDLDGSKTYGGDKTYQQ